MISIAENPVRNWSVSRSETISWYGWTLLKNALLTQLERDKTEEQLLEIITEYDCVTYRIRN
jgi:hypothetical protein